MLNFFNTSNSTTKPVKGYKITDNNRTKKYGIGANSLEMLKAKAKVKFPIQNCRLFLAKDGFEVTDEDYFDTIEPQTLFIVAGPDDDIKTESDLHYEKLKNEQPALKVSDIIDEFIEKNPDKFRKMILKFEEKRRLSKNVDEANSKTMYSLKSEHKEWFKGSEERCNTKEEVMARRSQDRIRGYYYKTKDEIIRSKLYRSNVKARDILDKVLEKFRYLLIGCDYFPMLFDRSCQKKHELVKKVTSDEADASGPRLPSKRLRQIIKEYTKKSELLDDFTVSLCNDSGDFFCHGPYSGESPCNRQHIINPYSSRENLILFQVWNLDHQIELSRTIIPSLIENVKEFVENPNKKCNVHEKKKVISISVLEYFLEIFSLKNLKLVHIVCHEKCQRYNKSCGRLLCEDCEEYEILKEFENITCPEEDIY